MLDLLIVQKFVLLLIDSLSIILVVIVFWGSANRNLRRWFGAMSLFILIWVNTSFLGFTAHNTEISATWYRINGAAVLLFFLTFYYFFVITFLGIKSRNKFLEYTILCGSLVLSLITLLTKSVVSYSVVNDWGAEIRFGTASIYYNLYTLFWVMTILYYGIRYYFLLSMKEKIKVRYLFIGILSFILANVVFNIILPSVLNTAKYQLFGDFSFIVFLLFVALAIVRQQLFGIRVIITTVFVVIINVFLALDALILTNDRFIQLFKGLIFILTVALGYSLIRSVQREVKAKEKLSILSTDLEKANRHLQQLDKTKSEFLSIASHQLRTPISGIKGYLSMILEGDFGKMDNKPKEILQQIYDNTERLNGLINDFLDVSRIERGKLIMERQETDITEMVQSIVTNFQPVTAERNLKFTFTPPKTPLPKLSVDPNKLRQVFLNLIDNAIKYTPKGEVNVALEARGNAVHFEVKDTGVGLEPGSADKLFRPFVRAADASKTNTTGSGLGLYVARKIIQYHGGSISAESPGKGKGTTFTVEIPFDQAHIPEPEPEPYLE